MTHFSLDTGEMAHRPLALTAYNVNRRQRTAGCVTAQLCSPADPLCKTLCVHEVKGARLGSLGTGKWTSPQMTPDLEHSVSKELRLLRSLGSYSVVHPGGSPKLCPKKKRGPAPRPKVMKTKKPKRKRANKTARKQAWQKRPKKLHANGRVQNGMRPLE